MASAPTDRASASAGIVAPSAGARARPGRQRRGQDLGHHDGGDDQAPAGRGAGGQRVAGGPPDQGGEHGLEQEDERGPRRAHDPLGGDHRQERQRGGEHAGEGGGGERVAGQRQPVPGHNRRAEAGATDDQQLHAREAHRVVAAGDLAQHQDVDGEAHGGPDREQLAPPDADAGAAREQRQPGDGEHHAGAGERVRPPPERHPAEDRHDDDQQVRQERRGGGGRVLQPDRLQDVAGEQRHAGGGAVAQLAGRPRAAAGDQREDQAAEQEPGGEERQRLGVGDGVLHDEERRPEEEGGHHQGGVRPPPRPAVVGREPARREPGREVGKGRFGHGGAGGVGRAPGTRRGSGQPR